MGKTNLKVQKSFTFNGKRYYVRGETEKEVYEKMALKKRDLETGHVILDGNTTVDTWTRKAFESYKSSAKEETKQNQFSMYNKHIKPYIGDYPLKSVRPIQCQEVLNNMSGMSYGSIRLVEILLGFIFRTARKNKLIYENPAEDLIRPKGTKGERRSITEYERKHLLKVCENDKYLIFLLMLYCSCRPKEAALAEGRDIMVKDGAALLHIRGTKTKNSDRIVPIPLVLYNRIKDTGKFSPIAPNSAGRHHSKSSYKRCVSSLERDLNISMGCKLYRNQIIPPYRLASDFVPYCLRHTYCTDLQKKGVDVRTAQKLMGHANIQMTVDIYTHVDESEIVSAAAALGAVIKSDEAKVV